MNGLAGHVRAAQSRPRHCLLFAALVLAAGAALCALSCSRDAGAKVVPVTRIVVVTPGEALCPREFRGAESLVRAFPAGSPRGEAAHSVLPDKAKGGSEAALASFIVEAAADPRVKALIVDPALPGTAEGFRRAKGARPELLCLACGGGDDDLELEASADLVIDLDRVYRAYLIPWGAKKMGAKALVALYTKDEGGDPRATRECAIMTAACADLELKYSVFSVPAGVDASAYARAMSGSWLHELGRDTAFYCSEPQLVAPLIAGAVAGGAIVADLAGEATRAVYAAALGLDLAPAKGEARKERILLEGALAALGSRGRLGLWDRDYDQASLAGLGEFSFRLVKGGARRDDLKALTAALDQSSPGSAWLAAYDVDPATGVASANRVLLRQDVYVLGTGYLQSALQVVPGKYLRLGSGR